MRIAKSFLILIFLFFTLTQESNAKAQKDLEAGFFFPLDDVSWPNFLNYPKHHGTNSSSQFLLYFLNEHLLFFLEEAYLDTQLEINEEEERWLLNIIKNLKTYGHSEILWEDETLGSTSFHLSQSQTHRIAVTGNNPKSSLIFNYAYWKDQAFSGFGKYTKTPSLNNIMSFLSILVHEYTHHLNVKDTEERLLDHFGAKVANILKKNIEVVDFKIAGNVGVKFLLINFPLQSNIRTKLFFMKNDGMYEISHNIEKIIKRQKKIDKFEIMNLRLKAIHESSATNIAIQMLADLKTKTNESGRILFSFFISKERGYILSFEGKRRFYIKFLKPLKRKVPLFVTSIEYPKELTLEGKAVTLKIKITISSEGVNSGKILISSENLKGLGLELDLGQWIEGKRESENEITFSFKVPSSFRYTSVHIKKFLITDNKNRENEYYFKEVPQIFINQKVAVKPKFVLKSLQLDKCLKPPCFLSFSDSGDEEIIRLVSFLNSIMNPGNSRRVRIEWSHPTQMMRIFLLGRAVSYEENRLFSNGFIKNILTESPPFIKNQYLGEDFVEFDFIKPKGFRRLSLEHIILQNRQLDWDSRFFDLTIE